MNVLVCDSDPKIRQSARTVLESLRHHVTECGDAAAALESVRMGGVDLVLIEMQAADARCVHLLSKLLSESPVIQSSHATVRAAVEAVRHGAFDILQRPAPREELATAIQRSAQSKFSPTNELEFEALDDPLAPEVCLRSNALVFREAIRNAFCAAQSDAAVLLCGERGTGKTVLARAIHRRSKRSARPFVAVLSAECSAAAHECELFGHGQASSASGMRESTGRIGAAEQGTLYFHEIAELPIALQPKLMRVLQERRYERVGESRERIADVRVVAATRFNLETAAATGRFREELLRALNVVEIFLPPLRQQLRDILPLAEHLLRHFAKLHGKATAGFTQAAQEKLVAYQWPGNVGELRQAVERGVILAPEALIDLSHMPAAILRNGASSKRSSDIVPRRDAEAECIRRALEWSPSIGEASARLGINVSTLYRKRKRYGI